MIINNNDSCKCVYEHDKYSEQFSLFNVMDQGDKRLYKIYNYNYEFYITLSPLDP